ncbi:hypothetical protein Glove_476g78 [Diversispora epigaea]|uniref:Uncharacterized protein n=1 Tax=Diversispora epigaea TaxID=1348612 RepID=A0A397GMT0_9GLOM|nr:hypothetical protein Glove_476g78 [Diversispora epigaea]
MTNNKHHRYLDYEEQLISNEFSTQPKKVKLDSPIPDAVESFSSNNAEQEVIPLLPEKDMKRVEEEYSKMIPSQMWTLKSGRKVEEIIYEFARKLKRESCLHSFIIYESDVQTKSLFFEDEWKEITTSEVKNRPELEKSVKELLKKYTVDDVERLREIRFEPFITNGCKYDRKLHFDLDFVNNVYRGMATFMGDKQNPLIQRN